MGEGPPPEWTAPPWRHPGPGPVTVTLNPAVDQTVFVSGFRPGEVNVAHQAQVTAGGKGVNVAAFLADFQTPVEATGFLGDRNQEIFTAFLAGKGIRDRFVRIPGWTRTGFKIVDEAVETTTDVNLPGPVPPREQGERLSAVIETLARPGRWFALSGSLPAGMPSDTYATLIRRIVAHGGRVALDTSGEPLRWGLEAGPALIKPNLDELRALTGASLQTLPDIIAAGRTLMARGISTVVISMGPRGAVFLEQGAVLQARPPSVRVKSTVGAGDAMVAGMLAGALRGLSLAERARLATAFALHALTCIGAGVDPTAVESYGKRICVERLDP